MAEIILSKAPHPKRLLATKASDFPTEGYKKGMIYLFIKWHSHIGVYTLEMDLT